MNKKMIITTLLLFIIISIGSVSASENSTDDSVVLQDTGATDDIITDSHTDVSLKSTENDKEKLSANNINIDSDAKYDDIQSAFNNLKDNDTINFAEGATYDIGNKTLLITNTTNTKLKNITIIGNGATLKGKLITNSSTHYYDGLFEIQNVDGFKLIGFNFIAEGVTKATMTTPSCVIVYNTSNGLIENNTFSGGRFGLYVGSKFNAPNYDTIIRNNTVRNVTDMGIISFGSARSIIVNNTIINPVNHGIDVRHGSGPNCLVEGNTIIGAREGIYLMHSGGHTAINNTLNNCDVGITCYGSNNIFCDYNNFTNNTKIGYLLSAGYSNIKIGENNNYAGLVFVPMPPTFTYNIVKADSAYVGAESGVFTQHTIKETVIEANDLNTTTKESKTLNVTLKDEDNNPIKNKQVKVSINGVESNITTNAKGVANITVNFANAGEYYYSLCFLGGEDYNSTFKTVKVTVNGEVTPQTTATVIEASDLTVNAKESKTLTVTLKDNAGKVIANKQVKVSVNGQESTVNTDANGVANVNVDSASAGVYYCSLYFAGDESYKASFKAIKVTVNKQTTKATMPAKKYKAKKAKKMTFTLKDASGKAIAGKKITFKVKGKTYSANTNTKGIATVTIKLTKKGKYTVSAKFAGDNTYNAISKSAKLTITK